MKINRTKNASRNIIWGVLERIVSLFLPFVTRTILIKILGAEYLGLNSLFTSILSVLSISELGFGTAIAFSMYKPIAEDDNETLCALLNAFRKIYLVIGTIILVAGLTIVPFLRSFIRGDVPVDVNLYILYGIHLFDTVIGYYLFSYKAVLFSAHQRNDLVSKRNAFFSFLGNLLKIVLLVLFRNYYAFVFVLPFITVATNISNAYLANKMFRDIKCRGTLSAEKKQDIKKRVIGLLSFKINGVVFSSVDTIVISSFLGLIPLAIYNNYYYIQTTIVSFLTILTSSITAGIGNKIVTSSREENYRDFINLVFLNGWICSWCSVCLLCLYQPFMVLWVGQELTLPIDTMVLMVIYFFLPRITTITYTYREAAGLWWEDRIRPLISSVVNLAVNIILVRYIGMNGVIISTLVCTIFISVPWGTIILFKNYFNRSSKEYFAKLFFYIIVTAAVGGSTYWLCSLVNIPGLLGLSVKAIICLIIPNVLFFVVYMNTKEIAYSKKLTVRVLNSIMKKN